MVQLENSNNLLGNTYRTGKEGEAQRDRDNQDSIGKNHEKLGSNKYGGGGTAATQGARLVCLKNEDNSANANPKETYISPLRGIN